MSFEKSVSRKGMSRRERFERSVSKKSKEGGVKQER